MEPRPVKFWLSDCDIVEVANAGTPCVPDAGFRMFKSADIKAGMMPVMKTVPFAKVDKVKKQVFGYVAVPDKADLAFEALTADEVKKAMESYLANGFRGLVKASGISGNHVDFENGNVPCECCIDTDGSFAKARGVDPEPGGWWMGEQCDDATWVLVEKGEYTGFSMAGWTMRTPTDLADIMDKDAFAKATSKVSEAVMSLFKGQGDAATYDQLALYDKLYAELYGKLMTLESSIYTIAGDPDVKDKRTAWAVTIDQFKEDFITYMEVAKATAVAKVGKEISAANLEVLQQVADAATSLNDMLARLQANTEDTNKSITKGDPMSEKVTLESLGASVTKLADVIEKTVLPAVEKMNKAAPTDPPPAAPVTDPPAAPVAKTEPPAPAAPAAPVATETEKNLSTKIDDLTAKLEKMAGEPGIQTGDPGDDAHDTPIAKDAPEAVKKAAMARYMIVGDNAVTPG